MYKRFSVALQYLLPQIRLTQLLGQLANVSHPKWLKNTLIRWAVQRCKIDMSTAVETNLKAYKTFNDFFVRRLNSHARPLAAAGIISPVDGLITQIGSIEHNKLIQAKGIFYTLDELLTYTPTLVTNLKDGHAITLYLAPKDYHRVHMPIDGKLLQTIYVPGKLFSVNPLMTENIVNLFARNERLICEFATKLGNIAVIFVGALLVAGIHTAWAGAIKRGTKIVVTDYRTQNNLLERGAEIGYFKFGSSVILLFPQRAVTWEAGLCVGQAMVMGQRLAQELVIV